MIDLNTHDEEILSRSASLLDSVAAQRFTVSAEVALACLQATELLEVAGGRASRVQLVDQRARTSIVAALSALSKLSADAGQSDTVLEAGRSARRALNLLR